MQCDLTQSQSNNTLSYIKRTQHFLVPLKTWGVFNSGQHCAIWNPGLVVCSELWGSLLHSLVRARTHAPYINNAHTSTVHFPSPKCTGKKHLYTVHCTLTHCLFHTSAEEDKKYAKIKWMVNMTDSKSNPISFRDAYRFIVFEGAQVVVWGNSNC